MFWLKTRSEEGLVLMFSYDSLKHSKSMSQAPWSQFLLGKIMFWNRISHRAMTYLHFGRAGTKCQGFKTHKSLGWHGERCVKASYRPKFVLPYQTKRRLEVQAEKKAVIIVDHGSKRKASNDQLDQFVSLYRWITYNASDPVYNDAL